MAIAWLYRNQYAAAQLKMLPVLDPAGGKTGWLAVTTASVVLGVSLLPAIGLASVSWVYILGTCGLGCGQLACAVRFFRLRNDLAARQLLRASLIYLPLQLTLITLRYVASV
jgi:protoheme IX farnesyltransferase